VQFPLCTLDQLAKIYEVSTATNRHQNRHRKTIFAEEQHLKVLASNKAHPLAGTTPSSFDYSVTPCKA